MRRAIITFAAGALAAGLIAATAGGASSQTYQERGAYLVNALAVCGNCHTPRDANHQPIADMALAGGFAFDEAVLGHVVGPNITSDKETGIGSWTIGQIVSALRNGRRPDGTIIGPPMPFDFYRQLSDRDAEAIALYLKSLKPVRREVPRSQYKIPLPPNYGPIVGHVAEPDRKDKIAYGGYFAGPVAHCMECHTPRTKDGLVFARLGGGGRELPDFGNPGGLTLSRNITPDETGIARWSDADVKRAILVGERPDGTRLSLTMPSAAYSAMTSDDVNAIVDYLRSLNPVRTE